MPPLRILSVTLIALTVGGAAVDTSTALAQLTEEQEFQRRERALFPSQTLFEMETSQVIPSSLGGAGEVEHVEVPSAPASHPSWIRGLFLPNIPVRWDPRVVRYIEFFQHDGRSVFTRWFARGGRYRDIIRRTFAAQGLPEDLFFVAMVESGFDPLATSPVGAAGLWQFMRPTGLEYGLPVSHWVDVRRDPQASTEAAARYLRRLHDRLGSWELALAAYNMGLGALLRVITKYGTNDFWRLIELEGALPTQTALYVPKIIACAVIGRNLTQFGFDGTTESALAFDEVEIRGGAGLSAIARASGTTLDVIRLLNPSFRRSRIPPSATTIRIPLGSRTAFLERWSTGRAEGHRPHVLRFGEDLEFLAARFRTTARELRRINEMDDEDALAGVEILVPDRTPTVPETEGLTAIVPAMASIPSGTRLFYRTRRLDTLQSIADFFRLTRDDLLRWNVVDVSARLPSGHLIQLWAPASFDPSTALTFAASEVRILTLGSTEYFEHIAAQNGQTRVVHRVSRGETLSQISARFGVSVTHLTRVNHLRSSDAIREGQELVIYVEPRRVSTSRERSPRAHEPEASSGEQQASDQSAQTREPAAQEAPSETETETPSESAPSGIPDHAPPPAQRASSERASGERDGGEDSGSDSDAPRARTAATR